jgi:hypothetical protein
MGVERKESNMERNRRRVLARLGGRNRPRAALLGIVLSTALIAGACNQEDDPARDAGTQRKTIEQPVVTDLAVAPEHKRVDLAMPSFSDPTNITNPLFPIGTVDQVVMLGTVDGLPFRSEVTPLPDTRIIEWNGRRIETVVSQYAAYLDGRIHEVALDLYAQADDGSVWYFGEDVFNYDDGIIADTEGTWFAGRDGPAAMIMPADPQEGDVYRPENVPGVVFEEVTVKSTGEKADGPLGTVPGSIVVRELHMDGQYELKTFAPGYGEFFTRGGGDVEAVVLAVPMDAVPGTSPAELETLSAGAAKIFHAAGAGHDEKVAVAFDEMTAAWKRLRPGNMPTALVSQMNDALWKLGRATQARESTKVRQASIDVARAALDLQLRHRPPAEIDIARLELWARQLLVDLNAGDPGAITGDLANFEWVRARFQHTLPSPDVSRIDLRLGDLRAAAVKGNLNAATRGVARLHDILARLNLQ